MTDISASLETLFKQGSIAASEYMSDAIIEIDKQFGDGFAKKNPALVAAFMQAAISDCGTNVQAKVIGEAIEGLSDALNKMGNSVDEIAEHFFNN
ncbi:hypothetical protein AN214_02807 [Pseudoalteromonas sp. P1-9]|uniref:hypothetical protein n=1 Tax=Pseudoalteromonas sp. P1-9 TaxID=1710354 RepID=UPI0006D5E50D|nr:hypothetical protein [Pseudoalteromonas sp. P1-9]KPV95155.1 hypothetical protein AN214_02807 [Pseudoalteromonas sp. P1-9]